MLYFSNPVLDSQALRTAAIDRQCGVDEGVCDPYWWDCVDTQDQSLFKLTALASSALPSLQALTSVCGKFRRDEALHAPSFSLRFIHFLSNILLFPHHCFPFFMCTSPSPSQSAAQSPHPSYLALPRLIMAVKGAIRYLWLFVLKPLALSDSVPFGDDKLGRHIAAVIGPNHSRRLHLLSKMKTAHI